MPERDRSDRRGEACVMSRLQRLVIFLLWLGTVRMECHKIFRNSKRFSSWFFMNEIVIFVSHMRNNCRVT